MTVCFVKQLVGIAVCPEHRLCLAVGSRGSPTCHALPLCGAEEVFAAHPRAAGCVIAPETHQGRILIMVSTSFLSVSAVSFLRSGTKLIFRRRSKQKEAGLSQSHDDLSNVTANSTTRKKAGSFSRRLIKRFSFKSKSKPKASDSTTAGEN